LTYYKLLHADGRCLYAVGVTWSLPSATGPGDWMPAVTDDPTRPEVGYHLCRPADLPYWLINVPRDLAVFAAEPGGEVTPTSYPGVRAPTARLLRRLRWDEQTPRDYLLACIAQDMLDLAGDLLVAREANAVRDAVLAARAWGGARPCHASLWRDFEWAYRRCETALARGLAAAVWYALDGAAWYVRPLAAMLPRDRRAAAWERMLARLERVLTGAAAPPVSAGGGAGAVETRRTMQEG
jgi:hypothetical protein